MSGAFENSAVESLKERVKSAQQYLFDLMREKADSDTVESQFKGVKQLEAELADKIRLAKAFTAAEAEATRQAKAEKAARQRKQQRRKAMTRQRAVTKAADKIEHFIQKLASAYVETTGAARASWELTPAGERPKAGYAIFRNEQTLVNAIAAQLTKAGLPILAESSTLKQQQTPADWAERGRNQLTPKASDE